LRYFPKSESERREMLDVCGVGSLEELLEVPDAVKLKERLDVVPALSELEIARRFEHFAKKNTGADCISFLGGGSYRHYAPPAIAAAMAPSAMALSFIGKIRMPTTSATCSSLRIALSA